MFDHSQIPPEVFATVFEIGILTWDIQFLPPLRLVCRAWNDIVTTTPHLWGIITIHRKTDLERLESQITRAKASPLSIFVRTRTKMPHDKIVRMLADLSSNWRCAEVSVSLLVRCRWSNIRGTLETLRLTASGANDSHLTAFFDKTAFRGPPRLSSFAAVGLSKDWILPFLSPSITYFELCLRDESILTHHLADTLTYLNTIPRVSVLKLEGVCHRLDRGLPTDFQHPVHLAKLLTLDLNRVLYPSTLLCELSAPSLQTLVISSPVQDEYGLFGRQIHPELQTLSPFFNQWSHGAFLPSNLHTLVLENCLKVHDVAFLIRWLARLPSLVRLTLLDDAIAQAAELPPSEEETNIFRALASSEGAGRVVGGWLCPSLMQLHFATDMQVTDLIPLARTRGGRCRSQNQ